MTIFRLILFFLLAAGLVCMAMYVGTKNPKWRVLGTRIIKWTVIAALGFFAVLLLERLAIIL
jgi:hypothetical protein